MKKITTRKTLALILLSLLIALGTVAVAQTLIQYSISGLIVVPDEVDVEISLSTDIFGNYVLPDMILRDNITSTRFTLTNKGSNEIIVSWTGETSNPNLEIELKGFQAGSSYGNIFQESNTWTIPRATSVDMELFLTDSGAPTGVHSFDLVITID